MKQLCQDKNIIITKADKGNITVVMNATDYEKKVREHLNTGPYQKIKPTKSPSALNKLKAETSRLIEFIKDSLGTSLWFSLAPKRCNRCRFYGLPKLHKTDISLRPVVDFTNSPTYNLAKYIS
ncbi:unnamed protein product [Heterobilharzia americana]|nr:unnamed protein product [Heterobilharzia americana]